MGVGIVIGNELGGVRMRFLNITRNQEFILIIIIYNKYIIKACFRNVNVNLNSISLVHNVRSTKCIRYIILLANLE